MRLADTHFKSIVILVPVLALLLHGCASSELSLSKGGESTAPALVVPEPVVLVCDIDTVTNDSETAGLSLALSALFRRDLFCVRELSIIPGDDMHISAMPYFLGKGGLKRLADAHGADIVVVSLLKAKPDTISIDLSAYYPAGEYQLVKTTVSGKRSAALHLEKQLVAKLLNGLGVEPQEDERQRIEFSETRSLTAFVDFGLGLLNERKGKSAEALISYEKAADDEKKAALFYMAEARSYRALNATEKTMICYEQAVKADEYFAEAWYRLNLYAAQYSGDNKKALECCQKALEIAPRFGKARLSLGTRLHDAGELENAIAETEKAAVLLRNDPLPLYNLGIYNLEAGERGTALSYFQKALTLDPKFSPARDELNKLTSVNR